MKKIFFSVITITVLFVILYFVSLRRTPYSIASIHLGFKVPKSLIVEQFHDEWANNPSGDGESFILFSFQENEKENLIDICKKNNFISLPIKEDLPDNFIYKYVKKENKLGFYKLIQDHTNAKSYKISVVNLRENKLIVYNVIY